MKTRPDRDASLKNDVTLRQIPLACADETAAVEFFEAARGWDTDPTCPHCAGGDVYQMRTRKGERNRRYYWRCRNKECGKQYSVRADTVMAESRIPLRHWMFGFWAICSSKKGVSALQIRRQTGLTHKSALFMLHRIRWAMNPLGREGESSPKLGGPGKTVEADETWVGGKPRNKRAGSYRGWTTKQPVMAMVERGGSVHLRTLERVSAKFLSDALKEQVDLRSRLMTDEHAGYITIGRTFAGGHQSVKHGGREYARGDAYNNTAESVFSLLKRGVMGTFHSISKKHLWRYLDEFAFRWNTRDVNDSVRTLAAIRACVGKRLRYSEPVGTK